MGLDPRRAGVRGLRQITCLTGKPRGLIFLMNATAAKATRTRTVTYLGARAEVTEVRTAGPNSRRVVITRWLDEAKGQPTEWAAGTVVLRHVEGDGRKPATFKVYGEAAIEGTTAEAIAAAQALLAH